MQFSSLLSITLAAVVANGLIIPRQVAPGVYEHTFTNQTGAVQGFDFITFGLFATTTECTAFCDSVSTCGFANSYHDVRGKAGDPRLTCSLYFGCHDVADLTNTGGQTQPDGTVNSIANSDGWCKVVEPTDPEPTTTEPTDPEPTPTEPTDPEPTPTEPTDPEPTPTEPTDPEPTPTEPTDPEPTPTEPTDPEPTPTEPTDPEPTDPEPTDPQEPAPEDA